MKKNRGFTLIELIVAMAIAAILICGVYANFKLLKYADTKSCAQKINASLNKLRIETMSKGDINHYLIIEWKDAEERYYMYAVTSDTPLDESNWDSVADTIMSKAIADRNITISYTKRADGLEVKVVDASNPCLILQFEPGSGAFASEWKQINVSSRADIVTIRMITKTGKHYIKN